MGRPVVSFEILAEDDAGLQSFYSELFGWSINSDNPMNYGVIERSDDDEGVPGGIGKTLDGNPLITFYVDVDDVAATLSQIERMGGRTVRPLTVIGGGITTVASFADPAGNVIGLMGPPPD